MGKRESFRKLLLKWVTSKAGLVSRRARGPISHRCLVHGKTNVLLLGYLKHLPALLTANVTFNIDQTCTREYHHSVKHSLLVPMSQQ